MEFLPVRADIKNKLFENIQFFPFIINLCLKYKLLLCNDYYPKNDCELLDFFVEEINGLYPWFLVGILDGEPVGAVWISHWHFGKENYHSCQIHGCVDKKFFGKKALLALGELVNFLSVNTGVRRIQTEIPEFNQKALAFVQRAGFEKEGIIRCATVINGKPINHILLSMIL